MNFPHIALGFILIPTEEVHFPLLLSLIDISVIYWNKSVELYVKKSLNRMTWCPEQALLPICLNFHIFWKSSGQFGMLKSS